MRRTAILQYVLIALAWLILLAAMPLPAAELNGFLGWSGEMLTGEFLRWLVARPEGLVHDWKDPSIGLPTGPLPLVQMAWFALVLLGLALFCLAPVMVRRTNSWRWRGRAVIRSIALLLLVLPVELFAPKSWGFPVPRIGLYLLIVANLLMFVALALTPAEPEAQAAFPVLPKGG